MNSDRHPPPGASDERLVDGALDDAWRAQSREVPSPELDAAILAAAHRASGAVPRDPALAEAREPERWWWPLAAAAVIGAVAFGVLQLVTKEDTGSEVISDVPRDSSVNVAPPASSTDAGTRTPFPQAAEPTPASRPPHASAPEATPPSASAPPAKKTERSQQARPRFEADMRQEPRAFPETERSTPNVPTAPTIQTDAPAPPGDRPAAASTHGSPASAGSVRSLAPQEAAPKTTGDRAGERGAASNARERVQGDAADVEAWITRIRAYRREGRESDAQAELGRFRAIDPDADARLPDDLKAWAAGVPR